jgi:S-adenosylmethionine hydrolase
MAIITLTTDLGLKDSYVGSIKGAILKELPSVSIVDISHDVKKFDITEAAFVLKTVFHDFPEGSIHIIGVKTEATLKTPHVIVLFKNHYFIGADNGIFSLIFDILPEKVVELSISQDTDVLTFPTKDVFVKAACHIARGGSMEVIGKPVSSLRKSEALRSFSEGSNILKGFVVYIDSYENIITNISKQQFYDFGKSRNFTIFFRRAEYSISSISKSYDDVPLGERLAIFSASGFLEIAMNSANASGIFGIHIRDVIRIEFYD